MEEMNENKAFMSVDQLAEILGISKSYAYDYIKGEQCPFTIIKLGKRYVIPTNSFKKWYSSLEG